MNKLLEINFENWQSLRDLYKINWPKYISSYSVIDTFIDWKKSGLVKIYSCDEKWRVHGTFIAIVRLLFKKKINLF